MSKKNVYDKPLNCDSVEDVDKTWRETIIEGLEKDLIKDGIFFGTPDKKTKDGKQMMIVAIKSDSVEPNFMGSVMEMLPRVFLMKMGKLAVWSEKNQCYGAEMLNNSELKTAIRFVTKELLEAYMEGLNPSRLFPEDKNLQKRWTNLVSEVVRDETKKMFKSRMESTKKESKSTLEELSDE